MTKVPRGLSSDKCVRALERADFFVDRQKGSHIVMVRKNPSARVIVPFTTSLPVGTLRSIIRSAGMTVEEFVELL